MGLIRTRARMLRFFAISSRSPVRRPNAVGSLTSLDGAGRSSGDAAGAAAGVASCCACSLAAGVAVSFLPQATSTKRATQDTSNTKVWRNEAGDVDIHLLRYADKIRGVCNCRTPRVYCACSKRAALCEPPAVLRVGLLACVEFDRRIDF